MYSRVTELRLNVWGCNAGPTIICYELSLYVIISMNEVACAQCHTAPRGHDSDTTATRHERARLCAHLHTERHQTHRIASRCKTAVGTCTRLWSRLCCLLLCSTSLRAALLADARCATFFRTLVWLSPKCSLCACSHMPRSSQRKQTPPRGLSLRYF